MQQRLPRKIIINHRRRGAYSPETQPREQKVGRVGQVEVDILARLDAKTEEELCILVREARGLLVGVGARARPDAFGVGLGEDGVFEEVVESEAVLLGWFWVSYFAFGGRCIGLGGFGRSWNGMWRGRKMEDLTCFSIRLCLRSPVSYFTDVAGKS